VQNDLFARLSSAIADSFVYSIVLDVEGVDLSREGSISIVQIATREHCFILDVLGKGVDDPLVVWLREVLEDDSVTKIIHDCRMDSDALHHNLNIRHSKVHDTSCWHFVITGLEDQNLNNTLTQNGLQPNMVRKSDDYKTNRAFWATRPLTALMLEWAEGDLRALFQLQDKQLKKVAVMPASAQATQELKANMASQEHCDFARSASVASFYIHSNVGRFIGPGGSSIHRSDICCFLRAHLDIAVNLLLFFFWNDSTTC